MKHIKGVCPLCGAKLTKKEPVDVIDKGGCKKAPCPKCGVFLDVAETEVPEAEIKEPETIGDKEPEPGE